MGARIRAGARQDGVRVRVRVRVRARVRVRVRLHLRVHVRACADGLARRVRAGQGACSGTISRCRCSSR